MEKKIKFKCTLSDIDLESLSYLMDVIGRMDVRSIKADSSHIAFECCGNDIAQLVDLHQRDIILCDISYSRIKSL